MIGVMMMGSVRFIDWNNLGEAIPAFLVISIMPLTFSVAHGMAAGFIAHAVVKVAQGSRQGLRSSLFLAGIAMAYFILMTLQS
jgi:adenine/guanine/hypoxanthine permease